MTDPVEASSDPDWRRRGLWIGGILVVLLLVGLIGSATVPRWWAHRVGDQVGGSITQGTLLGLFYGFVFTFVPILVLVLVLRWRRTPRAIAVAIVLARGNAAHAGDRVLDVEAPAFRGGSLAGALLAALLIGFVAYLVASRRR